ncbi:ABC transporter permease [Leptospira gomenensis]|uniref:Transport permease protein n=1 Tax=Leptospira gomenensis TaxID=2484974 RepID=A0A5F1Z101_9LEPT|nr:ABC transporter permease [Leptospira gomenensis]TGK30943.1 ABC transporter permease [Leptospira gomenensis]TGK38185.1 ABC transporter permease [Leptospira gomenensis]TGK45337.1 ABC transporter permease [Leptospira gomenensis]TGK66250.1 ABC transporter permease [Leptospira gomenensis]
MKKEEDWDLVISSENRWWNLNLSGLWKYRDLIRLFVYRDIVAKYKQTILGPLWHIIQPLFSTFVFSVVFGNFAKIPTDGIPHIAFYMSGIVLWGYFSNSLLGTSNTFVSNSAIFGKVYFPRLTVPVSVIISNLIQLGIQSSLFVIIWVYYRSQGTIPSLNFAYLPLVPLLIVQLGVLGLSFGILVSSLVTKYRDFTYLIGFGVQLWMYASPVVYPLAEVPVDMRKYVDWNPIVQILEVFRFIFFGKGTVNLQSYLFGWFITLLVLTFGVFLFNKIEKTFVDTV